MTGTTVEGRRFADAVEFLIRHRSDYDVAYSEFRWPDLPSFNWATDHFDPLAKDNSDTALWIVDQEGREEKYSFETLRARSNRAANFLRAQGVRCGDRVLVMLPNRIELWEVMLAAIKLGAVLCPTTMLLSDADLQDRIVRGRIHAVIADASVLARFPRAPPHVIRIVVGEPCEGWTDFADAEKSPPTLVATGPTSGSDACLMYFTSGTTGRPKMVVHTHRSYPVGHLSTLYWIGLRKNDVHLNISSPGWAKHAWSCFFVPWTVGATVFVYNQARFDAKATLEVVARCRVTTICAPPTAWRSFILQDLKAYPVSLREVVSAGEPLNPEIIDRVSEAWGLTLREGFGQTETTALIGNSPGQPVKPGSMGRPLPGCALELRDRSGEAASEGELCVDLFRRPAGIMGEYAEDPARTADALNGPYYRTADTARQDPDGYFWYVGRADDVFKCSDYRISPFELESALLEHPFIAEAAVVESPDPKRLFVPKAFVLLKPEVPRSAEAAHSILTFARQRLAPYQRIRILEFRELPKTISGKIKRAELRAEEVERRGQSERAALEFFDAEVLETEPSRAGAPEFARRRAER